MQDEYGAEKYMKAVDEAIKAHVGWPSQAFTTIHNRAFEAVTNALRDSGVRPKQNDLTANVMAMNIHPNDKKAMLCNVEFLRKKNKAHNALLESVKLAYRKIHMGYGYVGWIELSDMLHDALCLELGEQGYLEWVESLEK